MSRNLMYYFFIVVLFLFGDIEFVLHADESATVVDYNNEQCPVMGRSVNKNISIEYKGKKIYFCCPGCDKKFRDNPEKYLTILDAEKKSADENEW